MKKASLSIFLAACLILGAFLGCGDDNGTNPVPQDLVGTWWWVSATRNGVSQGSFADVSNISGGDTLSYTFNADRSWSGIVYDAGMSPLTQAEGTYSVKGDTMIMVLTEEDGATVDPPDVDSTLYTVTPTTLMLYSVVDTGDSLITFAVNYIKE